jgi:hypothetical protein
MCGGDPGIRRSRRVPLAQRPATEQYAAHDVPLEKMVFRSEVPAEPPSI